MYVIVYVNICNSLPAIIETISISIIGKNFLNRLLQLRERCFRARIVNIHEFISVM